MNFRAVFLIIFIFPTICSAQELLSLDASKVKTYPSNQIQFYIDESQGLSFEDVADSTFDSNFVRSAGEILRFGLTDANIWLRISVENSGDTDASFVVLFEDPSIYRIDQYLRNEDGMVTLSTTGISMDPSKKPIPGNENAFSIVLEEKGKADLFYRIESRNFISLPISFNSYFEYHRSSIYQRTGQGLYYGAIIIILFYAMIGFATTRSNNFSYYFFSIITFALITGTYDGTTAQFFHSLVILTDGHYDIYLSALSNAFGLLFMMEFLRIHKISRELLVTTRIIIAAFLLIGIIGIFYPNFALSFISLFTIPIMLYVLYCAYFAVKKKVESAMHYLIAYIIFGASILIAVGSLFDFVPYSIYTKYILHVGFISSLIIISIGLGHRVNRFRMELKQREIDEEVAKQKLIAEKNRELEDKVKERTESIRRNEVTLRSILDTNNDDSIWLIDSGMRLIDFNKFFKVAFKLAYGIELKRHMNIIEALPDRGMAELWRKRYETALKGEIGKYLDEYDFGGEKHSYDITLYPIRDKDVVTGVSVYSRDVTNMKMVESELLNKNESLTKLNQELDRFVYSASHDLKAPLASVLGLIDLTQKEEREEGKEEYLKLMEHSVHKLHEFIGEIENYARNARTSLRVEKIFLRELVEEILQDLHYLEGVEDAIIKIVIRKNLSVYTDRQRLATILANIINNALRYSLNSNFMKAAEVQISAEVKKSEVIISISDNGPGIDPSYHDKIFDMFFRVHESISGTGLGLYIVRETLEKLGGKISINSEIGKGAIFKINVPSKAPKKRKEVKDPDQSSIKPEAQTQSTS